MFTTGLGDHELRVRVAMLLGDEHWNTRGGRRDKGRQEAIR